MLCHVDSDHLIVYAPRLILSKLKSRNLHVTEGPKECSVRTFCGRLGYSTEMPPDVSASVHYPCNLSHHLDTMVHASRKPYLSNGKVSLDPDFKVGPLHNQPGLMNICKVATCWAETDEHGGNL